MLPTDSLSLTRSAGCWSLCIVQTGLEYWHNMHNIMVLMQRKQVLLELHSWEWSPLPNKNKTKEWPTAFTSCIIALQLYNFNNRWKFYGKWIQYVLIVWFTGRSVTSVSCRRQLCHYQNIPFPLYDRSFDVCVPCCHSIKIGIMKRPSLWPAFVNTKVFSYKNR